MKKSPQQEEQQQKKMSSDMRSVPDVKSQIVSQLSGAELRMMNSVKTVVGVRKMRNSVLEDLRIKRIKTIIQDEICSRAFCKRVMREL